MGNLKVIVQHSLTQEEARTRVEKLIVEAKEKYRTKIQELNVSWLGNTCDLKVKVMGFTIDAKAISWPDKMVSVTGDLSLPVSLFSGRIHATIQQALEEALK